VRPGLLVGISVLWVPLAFLFDGVTVLLLPVRLGADATDIGLVSFLGLGLAAGLQPLAGWLSDRVRHVVDRRVFTAAAAVPALGGLWLLAGSTGVLAAVGGYVLLQVAASAMQAGQQALLPEHVDRGSVGRASSLKAAFDVGGAFVAFLVLGAFVGSGAVGAAALVASAVLALGVLLMTMLVPPAPLRPEPAGSGWAVPPGFVRLILSRFLFLFGTYAVGRFLLLLVAERLGIPAARAADEAGGMLALFTLATAAVAVLVGRRADRLSRRGLMATGAGVAAAGILALVPAAGASGILIGGLLMAAGTAAFMTANWAATVDLVEATRAGRLMGIANLGTAAAAATAGLIGPLIEVAGFAPGLLLAAIASAGAVVPLVPRPARAEHSLENAT
jgi:MFS family permease